ncbi:MAG TPA: response regulator [Gemmataceae bacterium]|nr:response regulator [Gemmataceae bacterium]
MKLGTAHPGAAGGVPDTLSPSLGSPARALLHELLRSSLLLYEDWQALPAPLREELGALADRDSLLDRLVEQNLLTAYQADRVRAGTLHGMVLGNYRVLDRLGAGGMGIVFKAEHLHLRRAVAIKVLALADAENPLLLTRFFSEMRAVARLQHPNIITALDTGQVASNDPHQPVLHYYVMEYVPGKNLEDLVLDDGPLPVPRACELAYQVASALAEAHKHGLVHRDIKPSNIMVTPEGQAKLLDFGLIRDISNRHTVPGVLLGTVGFMAPEQVRDASAVDIRADIYSLGCTLFWCLTGQEPFPARGSSREEVVRRQAQEPLSVRAVRADVPPELEQVVARMMAANPDQRYLTPQAVLRALLPFLRPEAEDRSRPAGLAAGVNQPVDTGRSPAPPVLPGGEAAAARAHRILIVDDEAGIRRFCRQFIERENYECEEATDGKQALAAVEARRFDLVLLDINMPGMSGVEVLQALRRNASWPHLKVIMLSGRTPPDELAQILLDGADDFLTKPFSLTELRARVKTALRLKDAQERSDLLNRHLLAVNAELERSLTARDSDLVHVRNALVLSLAKLVEHRTGQKSARLLRLQRYCRSLAEGAAALPIFAGQIDERFIQLLESCAPLHDIGNVGLPDHILYKPGKLTPEEFMVMQAHTVIGAETLLKVARRHGAAVAFLQMAVDIARHHHERYDGSGYPDRLAGNQIPLAARIVAIGDVYDALRSPRPHRPPLFHSAAVQVMTEVAREQFDPYLLDVFKRCAAEFERTFRELPDGVDFF